MVLGSNPAAATSLRNFGNSIYPASKCQCLSEETLKAVGPFYLLSMPVEVKDPTSLHWKCLTFVQLDSRTTIKTTLCIILKFESFTVSEERKGNICCQLHIPQSWSQHYVICLNIIYFYLLTGSTRENNVLSVLILQYVQGILK